FRRQHHLGLRILRMRGRRQDGGGRQAKQAHAELRHGRQSIGPPAAAAESPLSLRVRAARGRYNERPHGPDAMSLHLYNTLTRRVEPFAPLDPACPTMYVCGPTVYNYVHIGNARGPVVFGVLAALLRRRFGGLRYARNITDVDDKINAAAKQLGTPISTITDRYAAAYREDMAALGVTGAFAPDIEPAATAHIPQIVA